MLVPRIKVVAVEVLWVVFQAHLFAIQGVGNLAVLGTVWAVEVKPPGLPSLVLVGGVVFRRVNELAPPVKYWSRIAANPCA